jgi:hypothetical protein
MMINVSLSCPVLFAMISFAGATLTATVHTSPRGAPPVQNAFCSYQAFLVVSF